MSSPTRPHDGRGMPSLRAMAREFAGAAGDRTHLVTVDLSDSLIDQLVAGGMARLWARAAVTWERPATRSSLFGVGTAIRLTGARTSSLAEAMEPLRRWSAGAIDLTTDRQARPRFFGGARFDPAGSQSDRAWDGFGGWQFAVPVFLLAAEGEHLAGNCTLAIEPGDTEDAVEQRLRAEFESALTIRDTLTSAGASDTDPALAPPAWLSRVADALQDIARGEYKKVVLARKVNLPLHGADRAGRALAELNTRYPNCYVFKFSGPAADWIGATPELMVALEQGRVRAASLAGSRPRSAERDEDRRRMAELQADAKERAEHGYVALALRGALTPLCSNLSAPSEPQVMTLANIHHLYTPFEGDARPGTHVLDLVSAVHPTPAVGGWPRADAVAAIDRLEQLDRGWYAGPIGWMDFAGDGEFAVALRAGLVTPTEAILYAGAGIVDGSVPELELAETETKLRPLRDALGAS